MLSLQTSVNSLPVCCFSLWHQASCCGWHPGFLPQLSVNYPHKNTVIKPSSHIGKPMKVTFMAPKAASAWNPYFFIYLSTYLFYLKVSLSKVSFWLIHLHAACGTGLVSENGLGYVWWSWSVWSNSHVWIRMCSQLMNRLWNHNQNIHKTQTHTHSQTHRCIYK